MKTSRTLSLLLLCWLVELSPVRAADADGFVPLFNGRDLSGWVPVNVAPGTFTVRDGIIVSTGFPTGVMRTERQYENFIIELEWRHMKSGGNAGLFIWGDALTAPGVPFARGIEVQILDHGYGNTDRYTTHGDVFPIHGAIMTPHGPHRGMRSFPTEQRSKPSPEWNHYRVVCTNGVVRLNVNGKEVSGGSDCQPRKGYICLESEGAECHFRNIRIKELPAGGAGAALTAQLDEGFQSLYTGVDLSGWKQEPGIEQNWRVKDWILECAGKGEGKLMNLTSEREFGDFELIVDWRLTMKPVAKALQVILPNGEDARDETGKKKLVEVPFAGDSGIFLRGSSKAQVNITSKPIGSGELYNYRVDPSMPPGVRAAATPRLKADHAFGKWNRFHITVRGDRVTVVLNNQRVIDNAPMPGLPSRGAISLQNHGDPVQFANLYIKELK